MNSRTFARAIAALALTGSMSNASAGYIAHGVVISVSNTISTQRNFTIRVSGTGPCADAWIEFQEADAPDAKAHQRGYAAALLALTTGKRVNIFNYVDNSCTRAVHVEVVN